MIVATILLGPGAAETVGDAIRSARSFVDGLVLIESGGGQRAVDAATQAALAVELSVSLRQWAWTGDYGAARQYALDAARELGATYAVTLDPDERLGLPENFREKIRAYPNIDVWIAPDRDTHYSKERVIRCAALVRWHGLVCENLEGEALRGKLDGYFWELPKTDAQHRARFERGVAAADAMIAAGDDRFKWRRHRASCLAGLGRMDDALDEYWRARERAVFPEDHAWTSYLICEQLVLREDFEGAWELACAALGRHAGFLPEFGWILGYIEYLTGDDQNASRWAQLALNTPKDGTRVSLRGTNCIAGCKSILDNLHGRAPAGTERVAHVLVPLHPRMGEEILASLRDGWYEVDEYRALKGLLRKTDRVLELGTGLGVLATYCAKRLDDPSRVLTVEADPENAAIARATFRANDVAPELVLAAVSADGRPRALEREGELWSTRTWDPGPEPPAGPHPELVDGVRLSVLLERHAPTLLIIDIEGGETSLVETPLPGVRAVLIEVHSEPAEAAVAEWLGGQGFQRRDVARRVRLYQRQVT